MKKITLRLAALLILALAGLSISLYLSLHYYEVRSGTAGLKSFCNINESFNCDSVAASFYADLGTGVPVSNFAAGFYFSLIILLLLSLRSSLRSEIQRILRLLSVAGLLVSLGLLLTMIFLLKTYCLPCLALDIVSGLFFVIFFFTRSRTPESSSFEFKKSVGIVSVFLGCFLGVNWVAVRFFARLEAKTFSATEIASRANAILSTPPVSISLGETPFAFGPADAPITIVEFSDFQCPFCRLGAQVLNAVFAKYPRQIRIVFKNFPLDNSCAHWMGHNQMHEHACEAAQVAACAHKQGHFKETYENLFAEQAAFVAQGLDKIKQLAIESGVQMDELNKCLASDEVSKGIAQDIEQGLSLDIHSTPTFYVNGHQVKGAGSVEVWSRVIDELLKKSQ